MIDSTHKYNLLKKLYETKLRLTATDFSYVSSANQYFVELEAQDLITDQCGKKYLDNMGNNPNEDEGQGG